MKNMSFSQFYSTLGLLVGLLRVKNSVREITVRVDKYETAHICLGGKDTWFTITETELMSVRDVEDYADHLTNRWSRVK